MAKFIFETQVIKYTCNAYLEKYFLSVGIFRKFRQSFLCKRMCPCLLAYHFLFKSSSKQILNQQYKIFTYQSC
ncbi:hypothetical protein HanIR_Chr16g0803101 [Helianthus annuus]|nr:hypothetical protein HanIR_Chr16g0803101 [Helianthus annuus]